MYAPKTTIERARALRRKLTLPEGLLWAALRGRRLGDARFRRQHPEGPYILDFYCEAAKLAVEVDGQSHDHPEQRAHDSRRTAWLGQRGIVVFRIAARDVLENFEAVLVSLKQRLADQPPPPLRGPPPPMGEE